MARSRAGLTEQDIDEFRQRLAEGKRPRVQLSGPHFPVGAAGTVVRIGSPDADGPDFVRVRVKVNGMIDELAFAPGELSLHRPGGRPAAKASAAKASPAKAARSAKAGPAKASPAGAAPTKAGPADTAPTKASPAGTAPTKASPAGTVPARTSAARATPAKASPAAAPPTRTGAATGPAAGEQAGSGSARATAAPRSEPARAAGRRRRTATPTVSFTVSSSGANWALTVTRGNKNLVRNAQLPPGVVDAAAELFGQPALAEAVSEINDAALAEARSRAERLRAELDELEAVLATHRRP